VQKARRSAREARRRLGEPDRRDEALRARRHVGRVRGRGLRARTDMKLRAPRDDDFDAMLELMNAHQLAAYGEEDVTADELRTWLTAPTVDPARDVRVLEDDGRLIGYVDAD